MSNLLKEPKLMKINNNYCVEFNEEYHTYTLFEKGLKCNALGVSLTSVTQLLQKHGLAPNYEEVDKHVLARKASRGSLIHNEIENYLKYDVEGFTEELQAFKKATEEYKPLASELIVNNDIVAGKLDLIVLNKLLIPIMTDIKTTYTIDEDYLSWQLALYQYLFNQCYKLKNNNNDYLTLNNNFGLVFHFDKDSNLDIKPILLKPVEEVEKLLECERKGEIYNYELPLEILQPLQQLQKAEDLITSIYKQAESAEKERKELQAYLLKEMEKRALKTIYNDRIKLTYVAATKRKDLDKNKLKKLAPSIYEECIKETPIKASLRISFKEAE